jgi:hypothetical protein
MELKFCHLPYEPFGLGSPLAGVSKRNRSNFSKLSSRYENRHKSRNKLSHQNHAKQQNRAPENPHSYWHGVRFSCSFLVLFKPVAALEHR